MVRERSCMQTSSQEGAWSSSAACSNQPASANREAGRPIAAVSRDANFVTPHLPGVQVKLREPALERRS